VPRFLFALCCLALAAGCRSKGGLGSPTAPDTLERRFYCNTPEAVNYNWGFPGRPDSTLCFFPSDIFTGTFLFRDSVYRPDGTFDSAASQTDYLLRFLPLTRQRLALVGFCPGGGTDDSVYLTADRFLRSTIDTVAGDGQIACRTQDTVSGTVIRRLGDTTRLAISFEIVSDTGTAAHRGTAYQQ